MNEWDELLDDIGIYKNTQYNNWIALLYNIPMYDDTVYIKFGCSLNNTLGSQKNNKA